MKRSPMPRRRTPLRGSSTLRRNRTILQRSAITKAKRSTRARPDEPLALWCEARIDGVCTGRPVHRHHVLRRSAGGGDEAANTRDLCGRCHAHVHAHPAWSSENGLLARRTS